MCVGGFDTRVFGGVWACGFIPPGAGPSPWGRVIDNPELVISGPTTVLYPGVAAGVAFKSIFLLGDDDMGDTEVAGIRSGRGGVLGVHFTVDNPSFGEVWEDVLLSVSAIMLFISCLITGPICFHPKVCFERVFLIEIDSGGAGGEEETPSPSM